MDSSEQVSLMLRDKTHEIDLLKGELADRYREIAVLANLLEINSFSNTPQKSKLGELRKFFRIARKRNSISASLNIPLSSDPQSSSQISRGVAKLITGLVDEVSAISSHDRAVEIATTILEASGLIDDASYACVYPDVKNSQLTPLQHYVVFGCRQNREIQPKKNI